MGDLARMERCQRFCEEFGEDMKTALTAQRGHECMLGTYFVNNTVHIWVKVGDYEYMDPDIIFEPDYNVEDDTLKWMSGLLSIDIPTIKERLKKVRLLDA